MARHILISDGPAQPNPADIDAFWERAGEQHKDLGDDYQVRSLGIDAETTTQILDYIKTRDKVATFSLPWVIEANGFPHPEPGTPIVLCDYDGQPHLIVRLTERSRNNLRGNRLRGILARWPTGTGPRCVDTVASPVLERLAGRLRTRMH